MSSTNNDNYKLNDHLFPTTRKKLEELWYKKAISQEFAEKASETTGKRAYTVYSISFADHMLPTFLYNPHAIALGVIEERTAECEVCGKQASHIYEGPLYTQDEYVETICAECIADGRAAEKFAGTFHNPDFCEEGPDEEKKQHLLTRTPGFSGWKGAIWPVHCNDYCKVLRFIPTAQMAAISSTIQEDIQEMCALWEALEKEDHMRRELALQGYLFQCLHCDHYRFSYVPHS